MLAQQHAIEQDFVHPRPHFRDMVGILLKLSFLSDIVLKYAQKRKLNFSGNPDYTNVSESSSRTKVIPIFLICSKLMFPPS